MLPWITDAYGRFSSWISARPDWVVRLVVGGLLLVIPVFFGACRKALWWPIARVRRWRLERRQAATTSRADFERRFAAPPGIVDHALNLSMQETTRLLLDARAIVGKMRHQLVKAEFPTDVNKKLAALRKLAARLRPFALRIDSVSTMIHDKLDAFVAANRQGLTLPVLTSGDATALQHWDGGGSTLAPALRSGALFFHNEKRAFDLFRDKQQDLSSVIVCATTAMERIGQALDRAGGFIEGEMHETIVRKLAGARASSPTDGPR